MSENFESSHNPSDSPESSAVEAASSKNEYYDKYLRALADLDNYQKRTRFDSERAREEATRKFFLELLPIWDNFILVCAQQSDSLFNSITQQFFRFFENQGISLIITKPGDPFDPSLHEVILCEDNQEVNTIIVSNIIRTGFLLNGKPIRPTQVKIHTPKKTNLP